MASSTIPRDGLWQEANTAIDAYSKSSREIYVLAKYTINASQVAEIGIIIPKTPSAFSEGTNAFMVGDRYNTTAQMHLQVNINYYNNAVTSITPTLYENASEKSGVTYYYFYR